MDLDRILAELHAERKHVTQVIETLERLSKTNPFGSNLQAGLQALEGGKTKRVVSPETRAKMTEAQKRRWAAARKDKAKSSTAGH
jgi:hypothetical protein